jgi:hypothetical protein
LRVQRAECQAARIDKSRKFNTARYGFSAFIER